MMYYSSVLVGFLFIVNISGNNDEDRYYFELILQELWQYPILKRALIHLCNKELDKCKSDRILHAYTNIINDDDLQKTLDYLIDCFIDTKTCLKNDDDWSEWSEWSACSVTCGRGRVVRRRTCQSNHQCLINSFSIQSNSCLISPCRNHFNAITYSIKHKSTHKNWTFLFIFLFPVFFTLLCIPLCIVYYIYELDFKIHALIEQILSLCNRRCETKRRRINIS